MSKCKKSHPTTFFRQFILGDTPRPSFRQCALAPQCSFEVMFRNAYAPAVQYRSEAKSVCAAARHLSPLGGSFHIPPPTLLLYHKFLRLSTKILKKFKFFTQKNPTSVRSSRTSVGFGDHLPRANRDR